MNYSCTFVPLVILIFSVPVKYEMNYDYMKESYSRLSTITEKAADILVLIIWILCTVFLNMLCKWQGIKLRS